MFPQKKCGILTKAIRGFINKFDNHSQNSNVIHSDSSPSRKDSPNTQITHETISVVLENSLEIFPFSRYSDSLFRDFEKSPDLVERATEFVCRLPSPCRRTPYLLFTDASIKVWGAHLGDLRQVSDMCSVTETSLHITVLELKTVFLAIKAFLTHLQNKRVLIASDNATVVMYLNK